MKLSKVSDADLETIHYAITKKKIGKGTKEARDLLKAVEAELAHRVALDAVFKSTAF